MKLIYTFFIISIYSVFMSNLTYAQELSKPYVFTVHPGTDEWRNFNSHTDMIKSCQIPINLIKNYTTKALIETCLSYPLLFDIFAYDNPRIGLSKTLLEFNGYNELINRPDFIHVLSEYYIDDTTYVSNIENLIEVEAGKLSLQISVIEMIIGTNSPRNKLNEIEINKLLTSLMNKLYVKNNKLSIYGIFGKTTSLYAILNIVDLDKKNDNIMNLSEIKKFRDFMILSGNTSVDYIFDNIKYILNEK